MVWTQKNRNNLGDIYNDMEVVGFVHHDGNIYDYPPKPEAFFRDIVFERCVIYCHKCGTTKTMDNKNLRKNTSCGCLALHSPRNFNWEGKSKKI